MENSNKIGVYIAIALSLVAIVLAIALNKGSATPPAGNVTQSFWDAQQGFRILGTNILTRSGAITTVGGASTNAATTSTNVGGCIQLSQATTTAQPVKLVLLANGLPAGIATSTFTGAVVTGLAAWGFGTCP